MVIRLLSIGLLCCLFQLNQGCKKFVKVDAPATSITGASVFSEDVSAIAVLTGLMGNIGRADQFGSGAQSVTVLTALSADELALWSGVPLTDRRSYYYRNELFMAPGASSAGGELWNNLYKYIYVANSAINGITQSLTLSTDVKNQLLGEALFYRAFMYFYLVNLYQNIPLILSTDFRAESTRNQEKETVVYDQIIDDLKQAVLLLSDNYLESNLTSTSVERVRPNKNAARSILARVYLYLREWKKAGDLADTVIKSGVYKLAKIDTAFLKSSLNNSEAILQTQPVDFGWNTEDSKTFVMTSSPSLSKPFFLTSDLIQSFEPSDLRRSHWIRDTTIGGSNYSYPCKYRVAKLNEPVSEYLNLIRLAEIYLIRAEASIYNGHLSEAQDDINLLRNRAGLPGLVSLNKDVLLKDVLNERRHEFFTEWGHRWLDLKRTGTINNVMLQVASTKGGSWSSFDQNYPIPQTELDRNPHLTQNEGY